MKIQDMSARSGLIRALITAWLVAGVFAMHGLTGNHDAATALTHGTHSAAAMPNAHPAGSQPVLHPAAHQMPAVSLVEVAVPLSGVAVESSSDGHGHAMGDVCLAMLTVLALAILGALAWRSLRAAHPVVRRSPELRSIVAGPSPPWVQPTLSKLCVLRT